MLIFCIPPGQQYNQFELMSMLSIAIIVGVLAVLICIGGLVYVVKLRWTKGQQQHNHHLHHGLNHHNHMQQQKGKLAIQTSNSGLLTNSSSNTPNTNSILRRMNNSSLIRPGNLPIKEKILLPANNNTIGSNNNSIIGGGNSNSYSNHNLHNHHHIHHPGGGGGGGVGGEELYDEKNPDVVPYNKGNLFKNLGAVVVAASALSKPSQTMNGQSVALVHSREIVEARSFSDSHPTRKCCVAQGSGGCGK